MRLLPAVDKDGCGKCQGPSVMDGSVNSVGIEVFNRQLVEHLPSRGKAPAKSERMPVSQLLWLQILFLQ